MPEHKGSGPVLPAETSAAMGTRVETTERPAPWVRPELAVIEGGGPPDSRSPEEWVASEGTLLRMLKRHYGWVQLDAVTMARPRRIS